MRQAGCGGRRGGGEFDEYARKLFIQRNVRRSEHKIQFTCTITIKPNESKQNLFPSPQSYFPLLYEIPFVSVSKPCKHALQGVLSCRTCECLLVFYSVGNI